MSRCPSASTVEGSTEPASCCRCRWSATPKRHAASVRRTILQVTEADHVSTARVTYDATSEVYAAAGGH